MRDDRIFIFVLKIPRSSLYFACTIFFIFFFYSAECCGKTLGESRVKKYESTHTLTGLLVGSAVDPP